MYENIRVPPPPPPPTPGDSLQNMTPNIIISSIFDEVSHAIKKKSCGKITTVTGPTGSAQSCPKSSVMSSYLRWRPVQAAN